MKKSELEERVAELERQNAGLREIAADLHWMARRYSDLRHTYAPGMVNDATRYLLRIGVELNACDGTLFARDGGGRAYDGLSEEEAQDNGNIRTGWESHAEEFERALNEERRKVWNAVRALDGLLDMPHLGGTIDEHGEYRLPGYTLIHEHQRKQCGDALAYARAVMEELEDYN